LREGRSLRAIGPSGALFIVATVDVRELQENDLTDQPLLVRSASLRRRQDGSEFLKLTLGDHTGIVTGIVNHDAARSRDVCLAGNVVWVQGRMTRHERYGHQLEVDSVRAAQESEYDPAELVDGPLRSADQLEADLRELVETIHNPHLERLLNLLLGPDSATWARYRDAPAAKHYHQAYRHGLLEHCLSVAQSVSAIAATFPGIDREVAVTGALLHDIGKLDAYEVRGEAIEMADPGRLFGEIALGYYRVRRAIEELDGFPAAIAEAVLHIILSHHGSLEHGSPVVPCTREATLVHMIDNLGGRLGSFDRIEKALPSGHEWSAFDKAIGAGAYFATRAPEQRRAA
jgi:3'-5' exoribonuclease